MADLKEKSLCLLGSATCNMEDGEGKTDIVTVPPNKSMIVTHCVVRNPSGSLSGGNDFDFGDGPSANTWVTAVDLSGLTATTDYYVVEGNNTKYTVFDAGDVFGVSPSTGASSSETAIIDVFGYLF